MKTIVQTLIMLLFLSNSFLSYARAREGGEPRLIELVKNFKKNLGHYENEYYTQINATQDILEHTRKGDYLIVAPLLEEIYESLSSTTSDTGTRYLHWNSAGNIARAVAKSDIPQSELEGIMNKFHATYQDLEDLSSSFTHGLIYLFVAIDSDITIRLVVKEVLSHRKRFKDTILQGGFQSLTQAFAEMGSKSIISLWFLLQFGIRDENSLTRKYAFEGAQKICTDISKKKKHPLYNACKSYAILSLQMMSEGVDPLWDRKDESTWPIPADYSKEVLMGLMKAYKE